MSEKGFFIYPAVLLSLIFCCRGSASGQDKHEATAQLVLADLVATNDKGEVVVDLTKDDFEVFEDGKRMDIHSLDFFDFRPMTTVPTAKTTMTPVRKKKLIVVFDSMNTVKRILDRGKSLIIDRLLDLIRSGFEVTVFEITDKGDMRILQPLTSDDRLIRAAVSLASGSLWVDHAEDTLAIPKYLLLEDDERNNERFYRMVTSQMYQSETRRRFEASVSAFLSILNGIKDWPGRKPILLISGGFPYFNLGDIQVAKINDPFKVLRSNKLTSAEEIFRDLIAFANSHNISFYSLYSDDFLRHLLPDISLDSVTMTYDVAEIMKSELYNLKDLAVDTMGVAMAGAENFKDFERIIKSDLSSYYELSYVPPRKKPDGRYHEITVKTGRPDLNLRYRRGYFDYDENQKESMLFSSAAFTPSLFQDIPFIAKTIPVATGRDRYLLWLMAALPIQGFLLGEDKTQEKKDIRIGLSLIDDENNLALSARINTSVKLSPEFRRRLGQARYFGFNACSQDIEFKKNRYRAVVALYDRDFGRMSAVETSLEVPDMSREAEGRIIAAVFGQVAESADSESTAFRFSREDGTLEFPGFRFHPISVNESDRKNGLAVFLQIKGARDEGDLKLSLTTARNGQAPLDNRAVELFRSRNMATNVWNVILKLDLGLLEPGDHVLQVYRRERPEPLIILPFKLL
ncbi:MAG: VWA domain-containing protein [Candidatus Aminicenantes bacterium]|nr:VWA domain-containing protein [Candidatus Aminicenantes bacterium]